MADEKRVISTLERNAYICALMVNFVDQMGPYFVSPVLVTYGQWIGASLSTIASFQTARGLSAMASNVWMPILSDRIGRKWVAFLSCLGVTVGYFIQAIAFVFRDPDNLVDWGPPCICFIIGRFVTGSFAGMMPVLQAYVTELSAPDPELITQRLVVMQIAATVGGMVLSPISGVIAQWGMQVPFFVVTGVGFVSIFLVPIYFKEVSDIRGLAPATPSLGVAPSEQPAEDSQVQEPKTQEPQQGSGDARDAPLLDPIDVESASFAAREAERKRGSPFCDAVVVSMFLAYFCLMIMINGGSVFLTPILFQQPSFGIPGMEVSTEVFQQNISKYVGFSNIPLTFIQVAVAILLFVPVTRRFGEVPTLFVMGLVGALSFPAVYIFGDKVWKVAFIFAFLGMSFGFLTPALGPLAARYGRAIYPKQMALVQGIPMAGLQLSNAFAQNILAPIVGDLDSPDIMTHLRNAYLFVGCVAVVFTFLFTVAGVVADARIREHERLTGKPPAGADEKIDDSLAQLTLQRSASSVGEGRISVPFATPVLKRAISERSAARRRAREVAAAEPSGDGS